MALVLKNPPANVEDVGETGLIPGWGRSPGGGHGNPLQYSCLENSMDRGAWRATVHGGHEESDTTESLTPRPPPESATAPVPEDTSVPAYLALPGFP